MSKKYHEELEEALSKFDVNELEAFMERNKKVIGKRVVKKFKLSPAIVKKATMCKMICFVGRFRNEEIYYNAFEWLKEHNMDIPN